MLKSFVYRLYPTKTQLMSLEAMLETSRRWYNECLAQRKTAYEEHKRTITKFEQLKQVKTLKANNPYTANS